MACPHCNATENQQKRGKNVIGRQIYKCKQCLKKYTEGIKPPRVPFIPEVIECTECGRETTNPKFCSQSCATKYNNRLNPKRKKKPRYCKDCGAEVQGYRKKCDNCLQDNYVDWAEKTIGDIQKAAKYQVSAQLRDIARRNYASSGLPYICRNCGYDKHAEICHIRAIRDFPEDTRVAVVSGLDNLVALCPNCHWEFDRGLLTIEEILSK